MRKAYQLESSLHLATTSKLSALNSCKSSLPYIICNRELGFSKPSLSLTKRYLEEQRLRRVHQNASYNFDVKFLY